MSAPRCRVTGCVGHCEKGVYYCAVHVADKSAPPLAHRDHGTRARYKEEGCRCEICHADELAYRRWYVRTNRSRIRDYQREYAVLRNPDAGRVDVRPLMALVNLLREERGYLCREIADASGVCEATVARIGRLANPTVTRGTFQAVEQGCRRLLSEARGDDFGDAHYAA